MCVCLCGSVAEWSKALVLGTSLSGRGFESHRCQETILVSSTGEGGSNQTPVSIFDPKQWQGWPSGLRREI